MPLLRTAACVVKGSVFSEEELEALLEGCCEAFSEQLSHADSIAEAQWLISKACDSSLLSKDGALMAAALGLLTIAAANGAGEKDLAHSVFQYLSRLCSALAQHDTLANLVAAACIRYMGDMAEKLEDLSPISECLAASVPGCSYAVGRCVFREAVSIVKKVSGLNRVLENNMTQEASRMKSMRRRSNGYLPTLSNKISSRKNAGYSTTRTRAVEIGLACHYLLR